MAGGDAWDLVHAGASDVVSWHEAADPVGEVAARLQRWRLVDELTASPEVTRTLVGRSLAWQSVMREVVEVARFTDASVLITGESGTGKELVARLIHDLDGRPGKKDFVILDCTTVVPSLSGSEFFGHERGAFTGAIAPRAGAFELADGGTLFLDEVGELPLPLQAELLRAVQERTFKRVGSNVWRQANFRLLCATNRNLIQEQEEGRFRADFYYRIAGWTVRLPSLRDPTRISSCYSITSTGSFGRASHPRSSTARLAICSSADPIRATSGTFEASRSAFATVMWAAGR